ncbi:Meiotic nuclear division [Hyphodiscus hymeniophilus]|uniref:Meiotic nuclear division protein 1 n=1 Tax=Hyphodiscus hymeniophilus TaxID=353542 RepID=A0A9P6VN47_9HELO|nr:Meiotic nuclear division [Hyphodiscus hymeniophilus]
MGVYTLKDLDKLLPSVAGIAQMQVKDYIQSLTDESLIRYEKIGSGNWYWCFLSDAKKQKENVIQGLMAEETRTKGQIEEVKALIVNEMKSREEDEEMGGLLEGGVGKHELMDSHELLIKEKEELDRELALFADCDPAEVVRKLDETRAMKQGAIRWTDNIESLASYLGGLVGREGLACAMMQACGDEYVVGEGLKELVES